MQGVEKPKKNQHLMNVWQQCLTEVKATVGTHSFETWFLPIKPIKLDNSTLMIQVPSQFFYEHIEENYVGLLRTILEKLLKTDINIEYSIKVEENYNVVNVPPRVKDPKKVVDKTPFDIKAVDERDRKPNLNASYVFDNFIEGDCNRLTRSAGIAIANSPGVTSFNPLFVYSDVGLGKTHLVQAIGNEILKKHEDKFVIYVSSEKFTNQFFDAIRSNNIQNFASYYMQVDVLIIDDVQFFSGKEKTQEIFFHIFNHLHQANRQIIMTSDRPPKDLSDVMMRLVSRFKWGLVSDMQSPDYETRKAIILKKIRNEEIELPENVIEYVAYSVDTNIRDIEGVIIALLAYSSLAKQEITLELAQEVLKKTIHNVEMEVDIDYIQKVIAKFFNISLQDMLSKSRKQEFVIPRQLSMCFAKKYTKHSLKSIGNYFGKRDHSTVIHAIQVVSNLCDTDPNFKHTFEELKKKLKITHRNTIT